MCKNCPLWRVLRVNPWLRPLSFAASGLPSENPSGALTLPLSTVLAPSTLLRVQFFHTAPRIFSSRFHTGHRGHTGHTCHTGSTGPTGHTGHMGHRIPTLYHRSTFNSHQSLTPGQIINCIWPDNKLYWTNKKLYWTDKRSYWNDKKLYWTDKKMYS